ncbi:sulfite reductase [NADPH] subunit beta [Diutina catenulata]
MPSIGSIFVTSDAKGVPSKYGDGTVLVASNDPVAAVGEFLDTRDDDDFVTLYTDSTTLVSQIPLLTRTALKTARLVVHAEIVDGDYGAVTALRDLGSPVVVSGAKSGAKVASLAYNLAGKLAQPVYHFYPEFESQFTPEILSDVTELEVNDIAAKVEVAPFVAENKVSGAKHAALLLGKSSTELVSGATAAKVQLFSVAIYQPFDVATLLGAIPETVETLTLVLQTKPGVFSPLALDFFQQYADFQQLKNFTSVVGASFGTDVDYADAWQKVATNAGAHQPAQNVGYGSFHGSNPVKTTSSVASAKKLEESYLKVLTQASPSSLHILNESESESVSTNPEYGFGRFLAAEQERAKLEGLVLQSIQDNKFKSADNAGLLQRLSEWLVQAKHGQTDAKMVAEIVELLKSDKSSASKPLLELEEAFTAGRNWLVGSDAWAYDLGSSGVHSVIASGQNINMLVVDSEPFGDKKQSGFRKKDIGLYAMNYGGVYVASVAIYSSYTQVLQAFIEAERFPGPSVVLAYLPYEAATDSTLEVLQQTKKAVDSGHWPLYRYNPEASDEAQFTLDSSNLRQQLASFLDRENKLTLLTKRDPELSRNLGATANTDGAVKQQQIAAESYAQLLQGLSGPPLTVAFASDGGNAEALAKKVHRQALARGLKSTVLAMDDLLIEDLPTETNVVFVCSTSGQGEFPVNGKGFWDSLKGSNDCDLATVSFSVFGLGDSEYWPRKEDKHYYNKPAKDLYAKLQLYGGQELAEIGLGDDQDADGFNTGFNEWIPKIWKALGVDNVEGIEEPKPLTNEDMKAASDFLRGTIVEGLNDNSTGAICAVDQQMTKFHGIYMQDDRDIRDQRRSEGKEPAYSFMVRVRLPGGVATPAQYLKMDELADTRGNGTLKVTTRATFQLHGVVKHDLKPAIRGMNSALMDTLAACGDVNRNVMLSALPHNKKVHSQVSADGTLISEYLLPKTTAYHEIWLEGPDPSDKPGDREAWENRKEGPTKKKTLVAGNSLVDYEPMYGELYLPRKFKISITVPPYNDVDVWAHDIGLVAIVNDDNVVEGYNVMVGGGMGTTHNNKKTYPRLGSHFGFVPRDKIHIACEKIMLVQRDFGDRTNRKHARLKYTIDDLGPDVYKAKVEERLGFAFEPERPFEITSNVDFFGWCKDEEGYNHFTCFIENGRVEDTPALPQKTGLKLVAEYLRDKAKSGEFRLTGNQHLVISNIDDADLDYVKGLLKSYKLDNTDFSALRLSSAACVAFPTCGLAMAESERYLPVLISKIESVLEELGLRHDSVVMRMTGCPNGCARPWVAEVALVGKAPGAYNLMLGGGHHGERLNKIYRMSIKEDEILEILSDLFQKWSKERNDGEPFGDWVIRAGVIKPTLEGKYFHDDIPEDA